MCVLEDQLLDYVIKMTVIKFVRELIWYAFQILIDFGQLVL